MRVRQASLLTLVAMLAFVSISYSLPVTGDHRNTGKQVSTSSLANEHNSASSSTHHPGSFSSEPTNKGPAADFKYVMSSPTHPGSFAPQPHHKVLIRPDVHHPDKVGKLMQGIHDQYQRGELDPFPAQKEMSKARVASESLQHLMNGRPVRVALHRGINILHQPGQENRNAAMDAHFKDNIHEISTTGSHNDPFRINEPRNPTGKPLSAEQSSALQKHLNDKVAESKMMRNHFRAFTKKPVEVEKETQRIGRLHPSRLVPRFRPVVPNTREAMRRRYVTARRKHYEERFARMRRQ
jgi:hypothetical protein